MGKRTRKGKKGGMKNTTPEWENNVHDTPAWENIVFFITHSNDILVKRIEGNMVQGNSKINNVISLKINHKSPKGKPNFKSFTNSRGTYLQQPKNRG